MKKIIFVLLLALSVAAQAASQVSFKQVQSQIPDLVKFEITGGPFDGHSLFTVQSKTQTAMEITEDIGISMENAKVEIWQLFEPDGSALFKQAQDARVQKTAAGKDNHFFYLFNIISGNAHDLYFGDKKVFSFDAINTETKGLIDKKGRINPDKAKGQGKMLGVIYSFGDIMIK